MKGMREKQTLREWRDEERGRGEADTKDERRQCKARLIDCRLALLDRAPSSPISPLSSHFSSLVFSPSPSLCCDFLQTYSNRLFESRSLSPSPSPLRVCLLCFCLSLPLPRSCIFCFSREKEREKERRRKKHGRNGQLKELGKRGEGESELHSGIGTIMTASCPLLCSMAFLPL